MARKSLNNLNTSIFAALKVSEVSNIPVLMLSNPGVGKTTTVYMFAKQRGYKVVELRGNSTTAEEVNGYDVSPKDVTFDHPQSACHLRPSWFQEVLSNRDKGLKTLLFLDEITTANEFVQAALLKIIFDRTCGREELPADTLIVSAGNYASNLTSSMSLLPPVMNRFMIYNITPNISDLDVFLNRFEGATIGKCRDYEVEIKEILDTIDKQQKIVSAEIYNKIGENFESAVKHACFQLVSKEEAIDLSITDLQNIYNDINSDKVYGFISFRTLTYLRDVAIAWYLCFGKEGIDGSNFRNAIDGLCGVGMKRVTAGKNNTDVISVKVGEYFHNAIKSAANDCEKLNNSVFEEFTDYFSTWIRDNTETGLQLPSINALVNKMTELLKIPELKDIERPVEENLVNSILEMSAEYINTKVTRELKQVTNNFGKGEGEKKEGIPIESLAGLTNEVNTVTELFRCTYLLINDKSRGYSEEISHNYDRLASTKLKLAVGSINSVIKLISNVDPTKAKLIPTAVQLKN